MNALPVYDGRYIKIKIRTYGGKVLANFHGLNVAGDDIECESFTVTSFASLIVCKDYLHIYLENCTYKIVDKGMTWWKSFESD